MSHTHIAWIGGMILFGYSSLGLPQENPSASTAHSWTALETFVLEPMESECIHIWVPAHRSGPIINRACTARTGCLYSCLLPAGVNHTKSSLCPVAAARLVAEYVAPKHEEHLPLTIVDGWRWEYLYSLSRYETASYELAARGGGWDYALEAILVLSEATVRPQWLPGNSVLDSMSRVDRNEMCSTIRVFGFSLVRPRDGYPKIQQF